MPIFRIDEKVVFFAHIPKCGGGTVETAIQNSGIPLSFVDVKFWGRGNDCWYRSSPQHLPSSQFQRLFSSGFFDYEFSVVRDPITRFLSAFNHNRSRIGPHVSFDRFLRSLERRLKANGDFFGYRFDNHFVPSSRFINEKTEVFFLEDGTETCLKALTDRLGVEFEAPGIHNARNYGFENPKKPIRAKLKKVLFSKSPQVTDLTDSQIRRIKALYREDYERFPRYDG